MVPVAALLAKFVEAVLSSTEVLVHALLNLLAC